MAEVKILNAVEIYSPEAARLGKKDVLVTYSVGGTRTYLITLPAEDITEDKIIAAIRAAEEARAKIIGKTFEV
jgi:hypothetical protein